MEEAIYRLKLAADAGADVCFIEGVKTKELLEYTVSQLTPVPVSKEWSFTHVFMRFDIPIVQVLVNVISGGLTPSFTYQEAERYGAKIISSVLLPSFSVITIGLIFSFLFTVFSLVSSVAMVHAVRSAMASLKKTGTDFASAKGMDPRSFFEVMGMFSFRVTPLPHSNPPSQAWMT
jgi:hypothetical protein